MRVGAIHESPANSAQIQFYIAIRQGTVLCLEKYSFQRGVGAAISRPQTLRKSNGRILSAPTLYSYDQYSRASGVEITSMADSSIGLSAFLLTIY